MAAITTAALIHALWLPLGALSFVTSPKTHCGEKQGLTRASRMPHMDILPQEQRLRRLDKFNVLVLNADYQPLSYMPLSTWTWQEAVKAVWQGRVDVVDTYEVCVRSAKISVDLPSVVVLKRYERKEYKPIRFSKRLLMLRDEFRCQYCAARRKDLTCDHVVPRSKGGRLTWTNAVAACKDCNTRKKNLSREQLTSVGLTLVREPVEPTPFELEAIARRLCIAKSAPSNKVHASWRAYLRQA